MVDKQTNKQIHVAQNQNFIQEKKWEEQNRYKVKNTRNHQIRFPQGKKYFSTLPLPSRSVRLLSHAKFHYSIIRATNDINIFLA